VARGRGSRGVPYPTAAADKPRPCRSREAATRGRCSRVTVSGSWRACSVKKGARVSTNSLDVLGLGVQPILGRIFLSEEDVPGGPPVGIISDALWQRRFGRDPTMYGRKTGMAG
jgi:hypothetical protein